MARMTLSCWTRSPALMSLDESTTPARGGCRPPPRRAGSFFLLSAGPLNRVDGGNSDRLHRIGDRIQMLGRQVQINGCRFQVGMAQQELNLSKIFPRLQKVSRPTVPQAVRRYVFTDTGPLGGISNDVVDRFRAERLVDAPIVIHARKQIGFRFHPAPVLA